MVERKNQFKILLSDEEVAWLSELAEDAGVTKTDYLRLMIREKVVVGVGKAKPKRPKTKR